MSREFKNFLIYTSLKDSTTTDLINRLKKTGIGDINLIAHRADVVEMISSKGFFAFYVDETIGKRDLEIVLRFLLNSGFHKNKHFYLGTSDPAKYKDILETFYQFKFIFINLPKSNEEIVKLFLDIERPSVEVSKTESFSHATNVKGVKDKDQIDLKFLKLFIDATLKVVKEMSFDDTITHRAPILLEQIETPLAIVIRGVMEIETRPYNGKFYLSFPKATFLAFYEKIVSEKHTEINKDNEDMAKELMNIIYGEAKKNFANAGFGENLGKLIPTLSKEPSLKSDQSIIVVPYDSSFGPFYIKVAPQTRKH